MDRVHDTGPGQERAEESQREREDDEQHVPDPKHSALLLDHDRVQESRCREPRHERGVLDRIPRVVAAPTDLDVRPVSAEQLPDSERRPRKECPATGRNEPALVWPTGKERPETERERHGQAHVAEVQERWVGKHVRVLEARRHARAVRRC